MSTSLAQRPWQAQALVSTPLGPLRLAATAAGLGGCWFEGQAHHPGPLAAADDARHPWLHLAAAELARYWVDPGGTHFTVPLDPGGTPFQQAVWQQLLRLPAGHTGNYGSLAAALGRPRAARAVGAAVGRNPISILIPCHRVLSRQGQLTGYAGGLPRKQALLAGEGATS